LSRNLLSLITVCYNSERTIEAAIQSVLAQRDVDIEYIIVDGGSNDGTREIISKYSSRIAHFVSEPDEGVYYAMNKGLKLAKGEVIGFLNSDDFFSTPFSASLILEPFKDPGVYISYGDLDYVDQFDSSKVVRKWCSGQYVPRQIDLGWMPAHPAFYARAQLYRELGCFDTEFRIAADYDLMIRFLKGMKAEHVKYVPCKIVNMRKGGISNKNGLRTVLEARRECIKAAKKNNIFLPEVAASLKVLRKLRQFF